MIVELPWPPTELSPNARLHWARFAKAKAAYRAICKAATQRARVKRSDLHDAMDMTLLFFPPTRRTYDRDNLMARMKSGIDGMCEALGIDDSCFDGVTSRVRPSEGRPGHVRVVTCRTGEGTDECRSGP